MIIERLVNILRSSLNYVNRAFSKLLKFTFIWFSGKLLSRKKLRMKVMFHGQIVSKSGGKM